MRESTGPQTEDARILVKNRRVSQIAVRVTIDKDAETPHRVRARLALQIVVLVTIDKDVRISLRVRVRRVLRIVDRVNFDWVVAISRREHARHATRIHVRRDNISTDAQILRLERVWNVPTSRVLETITIAQTVVWWMHVNISSVRQVVVWDPIVTDVKVRVLVRARLVRTHRMRVSCL